MTDFIEPQRRKVVGEKCSRCEVWWLGRRDPILKGCPCCSAVKGEVEPLTQGEIDDDRRTEEAIRGDKAQGDENKNCESSARVRDDNEVPPSHREFTTFVEIQRKLLGRVADLEKKAQNNWRQQDSQRRSLDLVNRDLLLHKAVVGRLLTAFMSPIKLEHDSDADDRDEDDDD